VTNPLVDHLMVSQDHMLLGHMMVKGKRGHVIGQVIESPDISQGHVLRGLDLFL
jgi:hypothetical protein